MVNLMFEWFQSKARKDGKEITMEKVIFTSPLRYDKILFFGGLSLVGFILVVFYHQYLLTRYTVGLLVMTFVSLSKSGLSRAIIKNEPMGTYGKFRQCFAVPQKTFRFCVEGQSNKMELLHHNWCRDDFCTLDCCLEFKRPETDKKSTLLISSLCRILWLFCCFQSHQAFIRVQSLP